MNFMMKVWNFLFTVQNIIKLYKIKTNSKKEQNFSWKSRTLTKFTNFSFSITVKLWKYTKFVTRKSNNTHLNFDFAFSNSS
jgi:hypothetical protein